MASDVIMPALGMAQDTGLIVAWLKAPGDVVKKGEALFEVETDKATMEVEAQDAGFLSAVAAPAGSDVPVGRVIARIVASAGEVEGVVGGPSAAPAAPAASPPAPLRAGEGGGESPSAPVPQGGARPPAPPLSLRSGDGGEASAPAAPASGNRILASPKARRLAAERGIDLARLAAAGVPQPFHVADLDRLPVNAAGARSILSARAGAAALDALLAEADPATDHARLFAAFARGAWRATEGDAPVAVTVLRLDGTADGGGEGTPLALADLTGTRLTAFAGEGPGLTLSIARDGGAIALTLAFAATDLPFARAARFLDELAARIEDPVRQLV